RPRRLLDALPPLRGSPDPRRAEDHRADEEGEGRGARVAPLPKTPLGLLLRRLVRAVAQMRDHVRDVGELLLEVALVVLQPLEQLVPAGEAAAEQNPRAVAPAMSMAVVHGHLLSSYRSRKRDVRSCELRSAAAHWSRR